MFPRSFYIETQLPVEPLSSDEIPIGSLSELPGAVYRDCLAFGTSPSGVEGCLYDDADCDQIDAACDLTVQKTELIDKAFYSDNSLYQVPASLNKRDVAPTTSTPIAPPAGDSAGDSDSIQPSTASVD